MENQQTNLLSIKGKILSAPTYSHSLLGEGFFTTQIEVKRLSDQVDVLPLTISERLTSGLKEGQEIALLGQLRSYNKLQDGHSKLMLSIFARELIDEARAETNNITIVGYLCKEPIYRTTPFGREIADMLVAVNRAYNKSDYLPCIAWGRNARFVKDLCVGQKLQLTGRVQSREYQKKTEEGIVTKVAYEISISAINILEDANNIANGQVSEIPEVSNFKFTASAAEIN